MSDSKSPIPSANLIKVYGYSEGGEFYDKQGLCDWEVNDNFVFLQKAFNDLRARAFELESRLKKLEEKS